MHSGFRGNDCVRGRQNDTNTPPTRKSQNSKSYERTRQLIENKRQEVSKPINLLKAEALAALSRQDVENISVVSEKLSVKNSNPVNSLKLNMVSSFNQSSGWKLKG
jgi:hypothetical protein